MQNGLPLRLQNTASNTTFPPTLGGGENRLVRIWKVLRTKAGEFREGLTLAVDDAALGQVIRGDFDSHSVTRDNTNEILSHLSSDMGQDLMSIFQFDHELGIRQRFHNLAFGSHRLFFRHTDLHKTFGSFGIG